MHYKPSSDRDTPMTRHKVVVQHEDVKLKRNWKVEEQLLEDYASYCKKCLVTSQIPV